MKAIAIALVLACSTATAWAQAEADDDDEEAAAAPAAVGGTRTLELGFAGLMDARNRTDLEPINLTVGQLQSPGEYTLQSGGYYRIDVNSDGTQELAIEGPAFFRSVWINEVVINDIEVRPLGLDSLEFDSAGTATISFVAVRPGQYEVRIPGTTGETQRAIFVIQ
jgi:hypothetical protein